MDKSNISSVRESVNEHIAKETVAAVPGTDTLEDVLEVYTEDAIPAMENIYRGAVESEEPFIENGAVVHNVEILGEELTITLKSLNEDARISVNNVGQSVERNKTISSSRNGIRQTIKMVASAMESVINDRMREETV